MQSSETLSEVSAAYRVHPLLDPKLPSHQPAVAKMWLTAYKRIKRDPSAERYLSRAYSMDPGGPDETLRILEGFCRDADVYLDDLLRLLPDDVVRELQPLPETREGNQLRLLFLTTFESKDPRVRYEAQRKLYLAKLLFDVDHCRSVRDAPMHKDSFEALLDDVLWSDAVNGKSVEICCLLRENGDGASHLDVGVPQSSASRCWRFDVRRLPGRRGRPDIEVYHYKSRFKKDATPAPDPEVKTGLWHMLEKPRWPQLGRRSGSIVSKMIRRGIDDPRMIQDLLGAMFIVGSRADAYALERRLIHGLGGPFRWRDRVDTLAGEGDREWLGQQSSSGFRVLKQIVDILVDDSGKAAPYLFPVEIQIYPVEDYLRTLYDTHFASHTSYKRRQFLQELMPLLFPAEIYGKVVRRLADEANETGENGE